MHFSVDVRAGINTIVDKIVPFYPDETIGDAVLRYAGSIKKFRDLEKEYQKDLFSPALTSLPYEQINSLQANLILARQEIELTRTAGVKMKGHRRLFGRFNIAQTEISV